MTSITCQKQDLREEIVDLMEEFLGLVSERARKYVTLGLARAVARKQTLRQLTEWRSQLERAIESARKLEEATDAH